MVLSRNPAANTLTVLLDHFSDFALLAPELKDVFCPSCANKGADICKQTSNPESIPGAAAWRSQTEASGSASPNVFHTHQEIRGCLDHIFLRLNHSFIAIP